MQAVEYCPGRLGRPCVSGKDRGPAKLKPGHRFCGKCMQRTSMPRPDGQFITIILIVVAGILLIIVLAGGFPRCSVVPPGSDETDNGAPSQRGAIAVIAENGRLPA